MIVLLVGIYILLLFLFNFFDFSMQIILLFEKLWFVFKSLIKEYPETIQIMNAIDEEHEDLNFFGYSQWPCVSLRCDTAEFAEELIHVLEIWQIFEINVMTLVRMHDQKSDEFGPECFNLAFFHSQYGMNKHGILMLVRHFVWAKKCIIGL